MAREVTTDFSMLQRLAAPAGKDAVDIGCGPGALVRELARGGARVVGVEVSEQQLAAARAAEAGERRQSARSRPTEAVAQPRYAVGRAQALPLAAASMDLAIFMRTLHHVEPADHMAALREVRRVLRPGALLYIAEPLAEGSYFVLTSLVED